MKVMCMLIFAIIYVKPVYAQKTYNFNYVLEYNYEHPAEDGKNHVHTQYRFVNSADNSYMLLVSLSGDIVMMHLLLEGGRYYNGSISKEDFLVEAINLRCPATGIVPESKLSDYTVLQKGDTIINTRAFKRVQLQPASEKKFKKGELTARQIIMDNSLNLKVPFFTPDDTAHRFYMEGENIPNGFLKESIVTDSKGKVVGRTSLVQYIELKKIIMIDKKCK